MPIIESYAITNFSGGIRRDKSSLEMKKNELLDARNVLLDDTGRIITRRGSQQIGDTASGNIESSFLWERVVGGSAPSPQLYTANNASTITLNRLIGNRITANVATTDTTITVVSTGNFASSGSIEIDGDLISYTGITGTTFTGCTGITSTHTAGAAVHQWSTLTQPGTAVDGRNGVYYAVLNNVLLINGRAGNWKQIANDDSVTVTEMTGEPGGLFITNYRDRCYVAGDGSTATNGDTRRVSYSARGDGTSWTASDFFDVEDQRGDPITGFRVLNDRLHIFKSNSLFTYDEIELKQRQTTVGAYSHKVVQEIDGIMYTFCPSGIFATNGTEAKQIGLPVKQYWKNFLPQFDGTSGRVVLNTFAGRFEHHYILYIFDITDPDSTADVVLDYDTEKKAWTVHTGNMTNFFHLASFEKFRFGDGANNQHPAIFGGDSGGKYYRFFENRYLDAQSTPVIQGGNIYQDLISNTGSVINAYFETPLYDLTRPELYKAFRHLRVYAERGFWTCDYRVENEFGVGLYRPLGSTRGTNHVFEFPSDAHGWRIGFRFSNANTAHQAIFNGFVFENTEVISRP